MLSPSLAQTGCATVKLDQVQRPFFITRIPRQRFGSYIFYCLVLLPKKLFQCSMSKSCPITTWPVSTHKAVVASLKAKICHVRATSHSQSATARQEVLRLVRLHSPAVGSHLGVQHQSSFTGNQIAADSAPREHEKLAFATFTARQRL